MNAEPTTAAATKPVAPEGQRRSGRCPCCGLNPETMTRGRRMATAAVIAAADAAYADLAPRLAALREEGLSLSEIADVLNGEGLVTRRGKPWSKSQVLRVLRRPAPLAGPGATALG